MAANQFSRATREQRDAVEAICLEHGTCRLFAHFVCPGGLLVHVTCEDGCRFAVDEDGLLR